MHVSKVTLDIWWKHAVLLRRSHQILETQPGVRGTIPSSPTETALKHHHHLPSNSSSDTQFSNIQHNGTQHGGLNYKTQHNNTSIMPSVVFYMLLRWVSWRHPILPKHQWQRQKKFYDHEHLKVQERSKVDQLQPSWVLDAAAAKQGFETIKASLRPFGFAGVSAEIDPFPIFRVFHQLPKLWNFFFLVTFGEDK